MKHKALIVAMCIGAFPLHAAMDQEQLQQQVHRLEEQSRDMQAELNRLKQQIGKQNLVKKDIQTKKKLMRV